MVYKEFIEHTKEQLATLYSQLEGRSIAIRLLEHFCGINQHEPLVEPFGAIAPDCQVELERALEQLKAARPLQYILGYQQFLGEKIVVKEGVLIPRPETEELVLLAEHFIKEISAGNENSDNSLTIIDIACGSGCIATALAKRVALAEVFACDISEDALKITRENLPLSVPDKNIFLFDILKYPANEQVLPDHFGSETAIDLIVSNPPYVTESEKKSMKANVLDYEPSIALFVPDDNPLVFYRALELVARGHLKKNGAIFMEINEQFGTEVEGLFNNGYYSDIEIIRDLFGKQRVVKAIKN